MGDYPENNLSTSKLGLVGLENMGNTCFMSSTLQCLSNIKSLMIYFVADLYNIEINLFNTLGSFGVFAL